ncbi:hypothetical protein Gpo141_00013421, partial [Globisporangium polare]
AITMGDFVDQDDLYPYCPTQRVRKDTTMAMKLSAHRRPRQRVQSSNGSMMDTKSTMPHKEGEAQDEDQETELVVVLTRWFLSRLRRPAFDISKELFHATSSGQNGGVDVMLRSMRQGIFPSTAEPWSAN